MRIALTANPNKPNALSLARRAVGALTGRAELVVAEETRAAAALAVPGRPLEEIDADLLVAIGGDGTFLSAMHRCPLPILPINAGTVGFLAEVDGGVAGALEAALERVLRGAYFLEERMRIAGSVGGSQLPDATNEIVVHTSQVAKMRYFEVAIDGLPVGRLRADGVILATPTGSTSYSLSAAGPVVDPAVEAIVLTALAPFQSIPRAVVVDPLRTVSVRLLHPEKGAVVVVDGQNEVPLPGGAAVLAYRSARKARFVRFGSGFFQRLAGKKILPWDGEPAAGEGSAGADLPAPS